MRIPGWTAALAAAALMGCASSFVSPPLDAVAPYREDGFPSMGQWELKEDELFAVMPPEATPADIAAGAGGAAVHIGLVENAAAHDLVLDVDVTFEPGAAIGPVVLAQEADGAVASMYWFALHIDGATLWRFHDKTWTAVGQYRSPINPAAPHSLRLDVRGAELKAYVDETMVIRGRHSGGAAPGRFGVMARQGIAGLRGLRYAVLDPSE